MFVIPCKYSGDSPFIISLVSQIRRFHPTDKIVVVDSDSSDKSYFKTLEQYDTIIEDISNKHWMVGAFWSGFKKFPNEDYYFFLHDSMRIKGDLNSLKNKELFTLCYFNRSVAPSFNSWNNRLLNETTIDKSYIKNDGLGCYGPIFGCKNYVMKKLLEHGVDKLLPSNKAETGYMEGAFGLCFESLGFNLKDCALYGDILELESPGGKSGPPPHNTSWQYPIEKFYASHIDKNRGWE